MQTLECKFTAPRVSIYWTGVISVQYYQCTNLICNDQLFVTCYVLTVY